MTYEDAQELSSSILWEKIVKELDEWIAIEMNILKNCAPERVPGVQQTIRDYERVKNLPSIVKDRSE